MENNIPIKIYYAHAIVDYNTDYENICISAINKLYKKCIIYNPKDIKIDTNVSENKRFTTYFFPIIDKSDLIIASPAWNHKKRGIFRTGTIKEIIYAIKHDKKVIGIIDSNFKEIKKNFFTELQWDIFG